LHNRLGINPHGFSTPHSQAEHHPLSLDYHVLTYQSSTKLLPTYLPTYLPTHQSIIGTPVDARVISASTPTSLSHSLALPPPPTLAGYPTTRNPLYPHPPCRALSQSEPSQHRTASQKNPRFLQCPPSPTRPRTNPKSRCDDDGPRRSSFRKMHPTCSALSGSRVQT